MTPLEPIDSPAVPDADPDVDTATQSHSHSAPAPGLIKNFRQVLGNTLIANVTTSFLWFALTFWAYLETKSVLATSIIGGSYMLLIAAFGMVFGAIVDHYRKKQVMVLSAVITLVTFSAAGVLLFTLPSSTLVDWFRPWFWLLAALILVGGVVESLRNIALSTTVTLLVPANDRDKANGMVGTVQGLSFMVTSVFSGLSVGFLGMKYTAAIGIVLTAISLLHLLTIAIPEPEVHHGAEPKKFEFRGAIPAIRRVPGLAALIAFSTFNNLVGGVFMALMDPYGLTLFSVQVWGVVLGVTSVGFIIGGGLVAKFGLGSSPLKTMLLANVGISVLGVSFVIREHWWLFAAGMLVFMAIIPIAEASEQTILQRVVPYETQGRVFGFAQSVEAGAAPISSFVIGPIAQFGLIPFMASSQGQQMFGWLLGSGQARGIALVFVIASLVMLVTVAVAFISRPYRTLNQAYAAAPEPRPDTPLTTR